MCTLRAMLREARAGGPPPEHVIRRSVGILVSHVREHPLRHAIRNEIRLFASELATDLARFPVLREWSTDDLQMLAGLLVDTMISTIEAIVDVPTAALAGDLSPSDAEADIARLAEKQLRMILLAVPAWRSRP